MHTQAEAMSILGCSKMTLSRYVKEGKLQKIKKGRYTYYDEHQVAALVTVVQDNQKRAGKEPPKKEPIPLPDNVKDVAVNAQLDSVGMQYLSEASRFLRDNGLLEECDRHILLNYAVSAMMWNRYIVLAMQENCISPAPTGQVQVHPFHKIAQYHEKQMLAYADRLGLTPLSRAKLNIEKNDDIDEMESLIG